MLKNARKTASMLKKVSFIQNIGKFEKVYIDQ